MIVRTYHPDKNPRLRTLACVGLADIPLHAWQELAPWQQASVDASGFWSVTPDPDNGLPIMPFVSEAISAALQTAVPLVEAPAWRSAPAELVVHPDDQADPAPVEDSPAAGDEPHDYGLDDDV